MKGISNKVSAAFFGGAVTTVGFGIAEAATGWEPKAALVAGATTLAAIAAGWLMPERVDLDVGVDETVLAEEPPLEPADVPPEMVGRVG